MSIYWYFFRVMNINWLITMLTYDNWFDQTERTHVVDAVESWLLEFGNEPPIKLKLTTFTHVGHVFPLDGLNVILCSILCLLSFVEQLIQVCSWNTKPVLRHFCIFFSFRLLSVLLGHSGFSSPPQRPMTSDFKGFSIPDFIHYIYFLILMPEKEPVFSLLNVQC